MLICGRGLRVEGAWNGSWQPVDRRRSSSVVRIRRARHFRAFFTDQAGRPDSRNAGSYRSDDRLSRADTYGARRRDPRNMADRPARMVGAALFARISFSAATADGATRK